MEINGIAHVALTVNRFELCMTFYEKLLPALGLRCVFRTDKFAYYVGGRTAVGIGPSDPEVQNEPFNQRRIGLHHVCFRARKREDIDALYQLLLSMNAKVVHPPEDGPWAPGYYSILFEDPDGIRLEMNYVPGQGVLADGVVFNPVGYAQ